MLKPLLISVGLLVALGFYNVASAHQTSTAYFTGDVNSQGAINGSLQVRLFDLERVVGLDVDANGQLTWGEVLSNVEAVEGYMAASIRFERQAQDCNTSFAGEWQLEEHFNEPYLVLPVSAQCAIEGRLTVHYAGFFDDDAGHKLILNVTSAEQYFNRVFSNDNRQVELDTVNGNLWETFKEFAVQGVIHIWIGIDHILFLMCLLLASVFNLEKSLRQKKTLRTTGWEIVKVITAFTLAHSLTLAAVALGWLRVSSSWVEVGIAITVLVAALNNIFPVVTKIVLVTFGFGLLHGMGFAGVLGELGLPSDQKLLTVLAFNVGVELGQLVIILIALPFLFLINRFDLKPRYWLVGGSSLIAVVAVLWIIERLPV